MHAIYLAVQKTKGDTSPRQDHEALKGLSFESPRGPVTIDASTRDIVQNDLHAPRREKNGVLQKRRVPNGSDGEGPAREIAAA